MKRLRTRLTFRQSLTANSVSQKSSLQFTSLMVVGLGHKVIEAYYHNIMLLQQLLPSYTSELAQVLRLSAGQCAVPLVGKSTCCLTGKTSITSLTDFNNKFWNSVWLKLVTTSA